MAQPPLTQTELLAPAGNLECLLAAVANGADAVYLGLDRFNARMRAGNFTRADLATLVPYLHARGKKIYVTMNVLVFTDELDLAFDYLFDLARAGVDGVIVQDVGLALLMNRRREELGCLGLHLSTQMTISCPEAIAFFERTLNPEQIVLARELSLREIEACTRAAHVPLEVFVHGALCVSYSGQCLTSERLGRRSANRGECAQACRMPYRLEVDGRMKQLGERRYLVSPQDLCALDRIPDLVALGVHSFKIEGRLKSPEYVAATTSAYRRALDAASLGVAMDPSARAGSLYDMQMAFSRGFSTGWLDGTNHPRLTHGKFGKKRGAFVGRIAGCGRGWVALAGPSALPLRAGDGFVIDQGGDRNEEQGGRIWKVEGNRLYFHGKASRIDWGTVRPGDLLWKTDDPLLNRRLRRTWEQTTLPQKVIDLVFSGREGEPLAVHCGAKRILSTQNLEKARSHPLTTESLREQFGRLGGTGYELGHCKSNLPEGLMMPLSVQNRMRRELVELLNEEQVKGDAPGVEAPAPGKVGGSMHASSAPHAASLPAGNAGAAAVLPQEAALYVLCRTPEQAKAVAAEHVQRLYLDVDNPRELAPCVQQLRERDPDTEIFAATVRIMKPHEAGYFKWIEEAGPDGVLVRNPGAVEYFRGRGYRLAGDFSLNVANPLAAEFWLDNGLESTALSYDLDARQVLELLRVADGRRLELTLHQHMPLFHMEHCVFCTFLSDGDNFTNCGRPCEKHRVRLQDRAGVFHHLRSDEGCRNTLYHGQAQSGARWVRPLLAAGLANYRIELLNETPEEAVRLVQLYGSLLAGTLAPEELLGRLRLVDRLGVTHDVAELLA